MAGGQGQLLDGVHAPDLMGGAAAAHLKGRGAARTRWPDAGLAQPALQGARAGDLLFGQLGVVVGQFDAEASCAPAGMLAVEVQEGGYQGGASASLVAAAGVVVGPQGVGPLVAAVLE